MAVLDAAPLIDRADRGLYDRDRIGPSHEGARLIGTRVARIIAASDEAGRDPDPPRDETVRRPRARP